MVASMMSASLIGTPVSVRSVAQQERSTVQIVRAQQEAVPRRAALGLFATVLGALATGNSAQAASKVAFQDSLGKGGSGSEASQSGYNMEGTKRRGLSPKEKAKKLEAVRKTAIANSAKP